MKNVNGGSCFGGIANMIASGGMMYFTCMFGWAGLIGTAIVGCGMGLMTSWEMF